MDASFINVGLETVTGIDIESRFHKNFDDVMGQSLDLTWSVGANRLIEQNRLTFTRDDLVDNAGRIGNPKWQFNSTVSLLWDRYQLLWQARYIGQTEFDEDIQNPEEAPSDNTDFVGSVLTFDDAVADRRLYNDLSLSADFDLFALTFGVSNITDQDPPLIDSSEGPNRNNAVTSSGFDLFGRTFFMNATMRF